MTIETKTEGNKVVISVDGRLDTNTSADLEKELDKVLTGGRKNLLLDFSKLSYISSAGLRVLLSTQKRANDLMSTLVLRNVNPSVMEVFELTGFSEFLTIENIG